MTTKITLDPAIVREVLGIKEIESPKIIFRNNFIIFDGGCIPDELIDMVVYDESGDRFLDIHRFKDKAIEWCAGKGWYFDMDTEKCIIKAKKHPYLDSKTRPIQNYPDKLSAELAEISFVHEQIQKEKTDEH